MSYILEALKKSDQVRKQGDVPGLQTVHIPLDVEQKSHRGLYVVIAGLMFCLIIVMGLLLVNQSEVAEMASMVKQVKQRQLSHTDNAQLNSVPGSEAVPDSIGRVAAPLMTEDATQSPVLEMAAEPAPVIKRQQVHYEAGTISDSGRLESIDPVAPPESLPYLHELDIQQQRKIPDMQFAGHVYSSTAYSRSVIINGAAVSEGDTLAPGLVVEQITATGVVFNQRGQRFKIDVLQDWSFD